MNKCDLEETKKVALEKFLSLVYDEKEEWEYSISGLYTYDISFNHPSSGFKITDSFLPFFKGLRFSVCVYLYDDPIAYVRVESSRNKSMTDKEWEEFESDKLSRAFNHLSKKKKDREDQQVCNRVLENLNNPAEKKEDEKTCNHILDNLNKKEKPSWFSRMASVFGRN